MRDYGKNFAEDVKLNKLDLANEAEVMPSLMQYYTDLLAKAKADKDTISQKLDFAENDAEMRFRNNGTGLPKDTEASIKASVAIDAKVVALQKSLVEAKEVVYTYEAAVDSLKNKSDMIKVEKDLWIGGYFSASN
jgi:hypothetical protein